MNQETTTDNTKNLVRTPKVLVIEDDRLTQLYYASILENLNLNAIACLTYTRAIEEIESNEYDLILSDVKLKDGNGIDLLRKYLSTNKNKVPFVIFSGYTRSELFDTYGQFEASAILTKPISVLELTKVISELLKIKK